MEDHKAEWRVHVDRALCNGANSVEIVLKGLDEVNIKFALMLAFKATNNMEKYEALIKGLDLAKEMKPRKLNV